MVKFGRCIWFIIFLRQVLQASTPAAAAAATHLFRTRTFYHQIVFFSSSSQKSLSMSSKPDLISWMQSRLGAVYEAREDEAFAITFDAVFSPSCEVRVNHTPSTLDAFRDSISSRRAASIGVTLSWENVITTGENPDEVNFTMPNFMHPCSPIDRPQWLPEL